MRLFVAERNRKAGALTEPCTVGVKEVEGVLEGDRLRIPGMYGWLTVSSEGIREGVSWEGLGGTGVNRAVALTPQAAVAALVRAARAERDRLTEALLFAHREMEVLENLQIICPSCVEGSPFLLAS